MVTPDQLRFQLAFNVRVFAVVFRKAIFNQISSNDFFEFAEVKLITRAGANHSRRTLSQKSQY